MIRVLRHLFISRCFIFDSLPAVGRHVRPKRGPPAPSADGASDDGSRSDEDGDGTDKVSDPSDPETTPSADDFVRGKYDEWVRLREARGVNSAPIVFFPTPPRVVGKICDSAAPDLGRSVAKELGAWRAEIAVQWMLELLVEMFKKIYALKMVDARVRKGGTSTYPQLECLAIICFEDSIHSSRP